MKEKKFMYVYENYSSKSEVDKLVKFKRNDSFK